MKRFVLTAVVVFVLAQCAFAMGMMIPRERSLPGLALESHRVMVDIREQAAVTMVTQVFRNQHNRQLEATFIFPLPEGASVTDFKMYVNGELVTGEIEDAREARETYEAIVRQMRDPGLLEYIDSNLLKLRVFPILPESKQEVRIEYTQALAASDGLVEYAYPMKTAKAHARTLKDFTLSVNVRSAAGVTNVYSPSHEVTVRRLSDSNVKAGFEKSRACLDRDFQLFYGISDKDFGASVISHMEKGEDGYFLLLLSPRVEVSAEDIVPKDVAFVLDVSGSMAGKKLRQAKKALQFCLSNLNGADRFAVVTFSDAVETFSSELTEATSENVDQARRHVDKLMAGGGTDINSALEQALDMSDGRGRPYMVVFLTDGLPTVGETQASKILANVGNRNESSTRVFSFGVGNDVNTKLLDRLTELTNASNQYVHPDENIEVKVSSFFRKVGSPLLADISLDFGRAGVRQTYPKRTPDLFKGSQIVVAGRYHGSGDATLVVRGQGPSGEETFEYPVSFASRDDGNGFVEDIWAGRKIAYLLGEIRLHGENDELKDSVVQLSKKYGIVTPYTSYLITEDTPVIARMADRRSGRVVPAAPDAARGFQGGSGGGGIREERLMEAMVARDAIVTESRVRRPNGKSAGTSSGDENEYAGIHSDLESGKEAVAASEAYRKLVDNDKIREEGRVKKASGRTFVYVDGVWVDEAVTEGMEIVKVAFASDAYFTLVREAPELKDAFALGDAVVIAAGRYCLVVDSEGIESAENEDVEEIIAVLSR